MADKNEIDMALDNFGGTSKGKVKVVKPAEVKPRPQMNAPASSEGKAWNRATFILDPLLVAKVKVVAGIDQVPIRNVVERAIVSHLNEWQATHQFVDLNRIELKRKDGES